MELLETGRVSDRRPLGLLIVLSVVAVVGVGLAWSAPANEALRVAATEDEFLAALPAEWGCELAPFSGDPEIGSWAECDLGSPTTYLTIVYKEEPTADREPIQAVRPQERCVFVGDHVTAAWVSVMVGEEVPPEEAAQVADAFDGWDRVEGEPPGCP